MLNLLDSLYCLNSGYEGDINVELNLNNCQINFHSIKCHFSCILADYKAILTQTFKTNVLLLVLLIIYTIKASSF
jgi:hypothetical protein